jgi:hypothetical protein
VQRSRSDGRWGDAASSPPCPIVIGAHTVTDVVMTLRSRRARLFAFCTARARVVAVLHVDFQAHALHR